jgi:hypothetical protein
VSFLDLVTNGSMKVRNAFAFANVVLILLCSINEDARFESNAFLCSLVLPK